MVALSYQLEHSYRAVERETKLAWHLRFLYSLLEYARNSYKTRLDTLYITLLGIIEVAENISNEQAKKELADIIKIQNALLKLEYYLEKSDFLMDKEVKEKWNKCLDALSHLEGEMRIKAFANQEKKPTNNAFIYSLADKSKQNVQSVLARYAV